MRALDAWGITVAVRQLRLLVLFCLCVSGSAGFAQDSQSPANTDKPAGTDSKAPAKHSAHKKAAASPSTGKAMSLQSADEAEKAARLAEGRKKFFEQSQGFENNDAGGPLSLGNGGTPSAGFKF
jgi:hypothetical protein